MRTLRLTLVGTVILALLAGLGGAVSAQADEATDETCGWYSVMDSAWVDCTDPMAPGFFVVEVAEFATEEVDGLIKSGSVITASDPRASGRLTDWKDPATGGWGLMSDHELDGMLSARPYPIQLVNEAGTWTGTGTTVSAHGFEQDSANYVHDWAELTGSGVYEGLTMYLFKAARVEPRSDAPASDLIHWGIIVPTAQLAPIPELPAE